MLCNYKPRTVTVYPEFPVPSVQKGPANERKNVITVLRSTFSSCLLVGA